MMVQCTMCLWLFDEGGTEVAGVSRYESDDGEAGAMPEGWWSSVLADCEVSCRMQEVS